MSESLVEQRSRTVDAALHLLASLPADDRRRPRARHEVVEAHLPLVRYLAARYRGLGEPWDDLVQVGTIGLIRAVDRFDPTRGTPFASFATPTVLGEIKRHFRDRAWAVQVPRRLRELQGQLTAVSGELGERLGRAPTAVELAAHLGVDEETARAALEAQRAFRTVPLEPGRRGAASAWRAPDRPLEHVVDRETLRPLLHRLPAREKRILVLRFFAGMTQSEIAADLGISQMHVSRLLARTVDSLRRQLADES